MSDDELKQMRDQVRAESAAKAIGDALWRFNEEHEETVSVYDLIGFVFEDLISDGMCPACLADAVQQAYEQANADPGAHINDEDNLRAVARRDDVLH